MSPEELTERLKRQGEGTCEHNQKTTLGVCKDCKKDSKPLTTFLFCTDKCDEHDPPHSKCGYFFGSGSDKCGQPVKHQ